MENVFLYKMPKLGWRTKQNIGTEIETREFILETFAESPAYYMEVVKYRISLYF